jgi:hypothetical protein
MLGVADSEAEGVAEGDWVWLVDGSWLEVAETDGVDAPLELAV